MQNQINVLKIVEKEEKRLINVGEDSHMRNTTFDNERSSKQIFIGVSLFLVFLGNGKVKHAFHSN